MFTDMKAAIFDLDGTLIDSMWVWEQIDKDYLESIGHPVPPNLKDDITHLSLSQTAVYFKKRFNIKDSIDSIISTWSNMAYYQYANNIHLKKGAFEFLSHLKASNIKIGLATSNSIDLLTAVLKNNEIYDFFDTITVSDEVKVGKDNPDIYLLSAKKLGVSPSECIVFEDIPAAVSGAKKANMKVVAILDEYEKENHPLLKEMADRYIYDYFELL
ncbi:MAG: HAD family phosphatase [Clostridium sp.]|nr:HAD family phosphatase [Clostridium sp.]